MKKLFSFIIIVAMAAALFAGCAADSGKPADPMEAPVVTEAPATEAPATEVPATEAPVETEAPTEEPAADNTVNLWICTP